MHKPRNLGALMDEFLKRMDVKLANRDPEIDPIAKKGRKCAR